MNTILALLFLLSLGLFIWGMVAPKSLPKVGKRNLDRRQAGLWLGLTTIVLFALVGITTPPPVAKKNDTVTLTKNTQTVQPPAPKITTQTVTETEDIAFTSTTAQDSSLDKGTTKITTVGVNGVKTRSFKVTYTDNIQTGKDLIGEAITKQPITQVTAVGTKVASPTPKAAATNCDPNYTGGCVPIASDVDCAGGSGNGPAYVQGPVHVVGVDIYGLDRDGDGVGCQ